MTLIYLPYIILPVLIFWLNLKGYLKSLGLSNIVGIFVLLIYSFFLGDILTNGVEIEGNLEPKCGLGDPSFMLPFFGVFILTPCSFIFSMFLISLRKLIQR